MSSQFVVSLDFELHWGIRDVVPFEACRDSFAGERKAVSALLRLFRARAIHATWATVGIVFAKSRAEALRFAPGLKPSYQDRALDPYPELERSGETESDAPFHFAGTLVDEIAATPNQELGTHTYSHYYCLEPGQSLEQFSADLEAARSIGGRHGEVLGSLVFPRNQYSGEHLSVARRAGVVAFRGNPRPWFWQPRAFSRETSIQRLLRFSDAYAAIGERDVQRVERDASGLVNVPATRFLRPWHPRIAALDGLRLARIQQEMTHAAKHGALFHLWWHPNNFSSHLEENVAFLEQVLDHFELLQRRYGMRSLTMHEAALGASDRV